MQIMDRIRNFRHFIPTVLHQREHLQEGKTIAYLVVLLADHVGHSFLFRGYDPNFEKWQALLNLVTKRVFFCLKIMLH